MSLLTRVVPAGLCFVLVWCAASVVTAGEADAERDRELRFAVRELQIAELKYRTYVRSEYPLAKQRLESEIQLAKADVDLLKKQVASFKHISHRDRNDYSSPTTINIARLKNALLAAQLELKLIEKERCLLIQNDSDRRQLYRLEIEAAAEEVELLRPKKELLVKQTR